MPGGRPKFVPPDIKKAESLAERGLSYKQIAVILGCSARTLARRRKANEDFEAALERGRARGVAAVANVLYDLAIKDRDPATCRFIMRAVGGWDDSRRVEVTGDGGGPIRIKGEILHRHQIMKRVRQYEMVLETDGADTKARQDFQARRPALTLPDAVKAALPEATKQMAELIDRDDDRDDEDRDE